MDVNTMYAASDLGLQDEYDTQIVKEVWSNSMSNMDAESSSANCEKAYEAQGAEAYNKCYNASLSCGTDSACNAIAKKYGEALARGYSKDFESFKKRTGLLSQAGEIGKDILGGVLSGLGLSNSNNTSGRNSGAYYDEPKRSNTGLYIGLGIVALAGISAAIYFARKK